MWILKKQCCVCHANSACFSSSRLICAQKVTSCYRHQKTLQQNSSVHRYYLCTCNYNIDLINFFVRFISCIKKNGNSVQSMLSENIFFNSGVQKPRRLILVGPQCGTCFMSCFWRLEFRDGC